MARAASGAGRHGQRPHGSASPSGEELVERVAAKR